MIPISLDDPIILRRTLEAIEAKIPETEAVIARLDNIPDAATLQEVIAQLNLMGNRVNIIVDILNRTLR